MSYIRPPSTEIHYSSAIRKRKVSNNITTDRLSCNIEGDAQPLVTAASCSMAKFRRIPSIITTSCAASSALPQYRNGTQY